MPALSIIMLSGCVKNEPEVYMFSFFRNNGEDGLHLAYSEDGRFHMVWTVYFDRYRKHEMGAVFSADLESWTDISERIHFPEGTKHGSVFRVKQSELEKLKQPDPAEACSR